MAKANKPTSKEHFVSQFYLKGFSRDKYIYQLDTSCWKASDKSVPIDSVCCEKDLYEFKTDDGQIINVNLIEKRLWRLETAISTVFDTICSKAKNESNYKTLCFLTKDEKAYLIIFMTTLILRSPAVLKAAQEVVMDYANNNITNNAAKNIALQFCLPIYKDLTPEENNVFMIILKWFSDKSFQVYFDEKGRFITSDNPVILHGDNNEVIIEEVIFPLSSQITLYMKQHDNTKSFMKNRLVKANKYDISYFNASVTRSCQRWIYSDQPFTKSQITHIMKDIELYRKATQKDEPNQ